MNNHSVPIIEMNNLMDDIPPERVLEIKSLVDDFASAAKCLTQREIVRMEWLLEKAYVAGREDAPGAQPPVRGEPK